MIERRDNIGFKMDYSADKKRLREYYLKIREEIHDQSIDQRIIQRFLQSSDYLESKNIFITLSFGSEINTKPIIEDAFRQQKRVFVPKLKKREKLMVPTEIDTLDGLVMGDYDIPEPEKFPENVIKPDLVIVPGTVFSRQGYRLGYGGGYYDRYLTQNETKSLSLVYNELLVDELPVENFDVPVDKILTEFESLKL